MMIRRAAVAVAVAGLLIAPGSAATAAPSDQDTAFLRAAHQSNLTEIAGGRIAQQKGRSAQVKQLGARFVADHTRLDATLTRTASELGVSLPEQPSAEQRALAARYRAASPEQFDALFIATQMDAHMKAMALGRTELAEGNDARAKTVARNAAPVIESHHESLDAAARDLGVPSMVDSGTGGQAADRVVDAWGASLIGLGLVLVAGAVLLLRRRRIIGG